MEPGNPQLSADKLYDLSYWELLRLYNIDSDDYCQSDDTMPSDNEEQTFAPLPDSQPYI